MTYHDKVSTHNKRMMIAISCVAIGLLMTTGILLTIGTISAQGATDTAPDAPAVVECDGGSWNCEDVEDPLFRLKNMTDRSLRYKSDGTPCVVFGNDGLYYACYNYTTNLWSGASVPIDNSPLVGEYAALAFTTSNIPFISYYDGADGSLKLAYYVGSGGSGCSIGGSWQCDMIVDENTTCTSGSVYAPQTEETLPGESSAPDKWLEALISGNFWQDKILEPAQELLPGMLAPTDAVVDGVGRWTSIAFGDHGLHISFADWNGSNDALKYYFWDFVNPGKCIKVDTNGNDADNHDFLWSSIAVDGSKVHISYFLDKYDQLKYANSNGGNAFVIKQIEPRRDLSPTTTDPGTGAFSSIALDGDGDPHISYYKWWGRDQPYPDGDLRRAYKSGGDSDCSGPDLEPNTWQCVSEDNSDNVGGYTSIAFEKKPADDNNYIISYYDFKNGNLKSEGGYDDGTLYSTGNVGLYTSVDTHYHSGYNKKKIAIAFLDETEGELIVAENVGGDGWVKLGAKGYVAKFGDVGLYNSLAIRQDDDIPFISYYNETNGFLKYAFGTMLVTPPPLYFWESAAVTDNLYAGTFSSIGIGGPDSPGDSDGEPVIAFYSTYDLEEDDEEDAVTEDLMYAYRDEGSLEWVFDEVDTTGDVGQYVDMAIDSTGIPHISYYDASRSALIYATRNSINTTWVTATLDNNGDVGLFTSIALNPNDLPYIAYYDYTNSRIKFVFRTAFDTWSIPGVVATGVGDYVHVDDKHIEADLSIAYEDAATDLIHVSYFDQTGYDSNLKNALGSLMYVQDTVGALGAVDWDQPPITLDSSVAMVGQYNDLVVKNSTGEINVCYYDGTNGDLKVAKWNGSWNLHVIDSAGDTGLSCSTALESDGEVTVSYYDQSRGSLRFAHNPVDTPDSYFNYIPIVIK
jgi:hypothetical protein